VDDGEVMVILGPSGQGKTVLIKVMIGLLEADSGIIRYDDLNIVGLADQAMSAFRRQTAFVFQYGALLDSLIIADNLLLFPRMHYRLSEQAMVERAKMILALVGLEESILTKYPEELSGGMRKRVAIARAMIQDPKYLFYDEPTAGLDQGNAEKVGELILTLKCNTQVTSIIVTHDVQLARQVADRVALLKRGRILLVGSPDDLSPRTLELLYDTRNGNGL
jgi:phospholipid/cholesterol/gamma-HCH transport system ATP-binding protein